MPVRNNFVVELKDLIAMPNIADRLRVPAKTDKVLGPSDLQLSGFGPPVGRACEEWVVE